MDVINDYRDLKVWKNSMDLAVDIYDLTKAFPRQEVFGLVSQMRRAAVSIPSNIAEGFGRGQRRSFIQFLRIAQGSLKELETQTALCERLLFLSDQHSKDLAARYEAMGKMLRSFISSLEKKAEQV
jgi:four helix bundle protein